MMTESDRARHERYMRRCIELARKARETQDTPVGSLIVQGDEIVAEAAEAVRARSDVTAHAEIEALRLATTRLGSRDLSGLTLYTSVEPCVMCAYALRLARLSMIVTGTASGDAASEWNGCALLTNPDVLPTRTPPVLVRHVLDGECRRVLMDRGAISG